MSYPSSYDSIANVTSGDLITASQVNSQIDAINAVESALGLSPAGPYSTVADAIAGKLDANYVDDTGAADAYVVTLTPTPSAYSAGLTVVFKAAHANTGASTVNVNSMGAQSIKKQSDSALEAGDIQADQIVAVVYDGTNFQMVNTVQISPSYTGQTTIDTLGTVTSGTWQATTLAVAYGGTGATTAAAAFDALSPMTDVGDIIYGAASGQGFRLAGNVSTTKKFLTGTGTGGAANAPSWDTISASDLPTLDQVPSPTANVSLNSHRITSLADPTSLTDAATANVVQTGALSYAADSGSADAYAITLSPAPGAYHAGMALVFKAANANTGASTLDVNSLGAKSIKKQQGDDLEAGDIAAGQMVAVTYDGTNFQMANTLQVSPSYSGQTSIDTVGTVTSGTWQGTSVAIAHGGTGQTSASAAFDALSPMTDVGDVIYGATSGQGTRLAGNTSTTKKFLASTGSGSAATAPAWDTLQAGDIPTLDHTYISDFNSQVRANRLDQMSAPQADVSMNSYSLTDLTDPVDAQDAATRHYVDSLTFKPAVRAATKSALSAYGVSGNVLTASANGQLSVDSVSCNANDRILVKNESSSQYNGIYVVTQAGDASHPWILTRASDMSSSSQVAGAAVYVREGGSGGSGSNAYAVYVTTGIDSSFVLNTTSMSWSDLIALHEISSWAARVATTTTLPAYTSPSNNQLTASSNGALSIDGISLSTGDRVLVKNETGGNQKYNGMYRVKTAGSAGSAWSLSRVTDMNSSGKVPGSFFVVTDGSVNAGTMWGNTNTSSFSLNSTAMTFAQLGGLPQADVNLNFQRVTNLADATAASDAVNVNVLQSTLTQHAAGGGSTNTYTASLSPAPASYVAGLLLYVLIPASSTNTGACTLNVNSLGAKSIKTQAGADPASGALVSGGIYAFIYDGTNFQLI